MLNIKTKLSNLKKIGKISFYYILVLSLVLFLYPIQITKAAAMTNLSDTLSRLKTLEVADHTVTFTLPTTLGTGENFTIVFTSFTMGSVEFGDVDVKDDGVDIPLAATPGTGASSDRGAAFSGTTLTITQNDTDTIASGSVIEVQVGLNATFGTTGDAQITNPASAVYVFTLGGTNDTGKIAVEIIDDEQIPVTATVNPTITFTVVNTALALGTLDSASRSSAGPNEITIGTNGTNGYTITVKDIGDTSNPGLYNTPATKLIASATAAPIPIGEEGYGGQCTVTAGSGTCAFASGAANDVTAFTLGGDTFASYGSKPASTDTYDIKVKATISTSTDAGSYVDTLTLIGTANF